MFTGLIETIGRIAAIERRGSGLLLRVDLRGAAESVRRGDSIALAGVCQTVAALDGTVAAFDSVAETLARTTLGRWTVGTAVNVERSLRPSDRMGGHFVAGHVDATARVLENREGSDGWRLRIELPEALRPQVAPKGCIVVDGASLTVATVEPAAFGIALIPTTLGETTLGTLRAGDLVNLETDLLAKYVCRAMATAAGGDADARLTDALRRAGFIEPA